VPGVPFIMKDLAARAVVTGDAQDMSREILTKWNPGLNEQTFDSYNAAKFIPKGSDLVFNMHYTAAGTASTDRSRVGLVFAKKPPKLRYFMHNGPTGANLAIPPRDGNAEILSEMTTNVEAKLVYVQPHMHLRGKDYELRVIYPSGKSETVFKAKGDFNWQMGYDLAQPISLPKGTRIVGLAHYDNSANNKYNPDPNKLVLWGDQNWEEMQNCFLGILIDPKVEPKAGVAPSGPGLLPRGQSGPTFASLR